MSKNDPVLECVDNTGITGVILTLEEEKWRWIASGVVPRSRTIRLPAECKNKTVLIFVNMKDENNIKHVSIDKHAWRDVRMVEGEKKGKPFEVPDSCVLSLPTYCKDKQYKVAVEVINDDTTQESTI